MPHPHWLSIPLLGRDRPAPTVSCVLSGGGSRASFQLGALDFLYRHDPEFTPSIFVGASAGAILAAVLAQSSDRDEQHRSVRQLTEIWRGLTDPEQMFAPRPWLVRAKNEAPAWLNLVNPPVPAPAAPTRSLVKLPFLHSDAPMSPNSPPQPLDALEMAMTPDEEVNPAWSFGTLTSLFSNIGKLPRIGSDLWAIHRGMEASKSLYRPGKVMLELLDPTVFDPERVTAAGTTLRIAMVSLESGELRFMRQDGVLVDRYDRVYDRGPHPLDTGVLASCSIPAVFRPIPLGNETYVDGGVRENLPTQLSIEHLGADRTYVVSSMGEGLPTRASMRDADLFAIMMRSTEILIDEAGRDELQYSATTDAVVIRPVLDIHDPMTVDPGLIAINMDYGWLRAAEAVLAHDEEEVARHSRLMVLRMRCLRLEQQWLAHHDGPGALVDTLRQAKAEIRDLVSLCDTAALPQGAERWFRTFEPRATTPQVEPPWLPLGEIAR
ncbi:patatin-like phospholipase family protein [Tessaracoccus antarcticus]|nr:patatin-like phospholipase family protein [Tessaracoccus antarcticus]